MRRCGQILAMRRFFSLAMSPAVLLAAAAGLVSGRAFGRQGGVAVIDWGLLETCLALGLILGISRQVKEESLDRPRKESLLE